MHVARLSVLFEDLRLESTAAQFTSSIPQVDTTSKSYRYFYFLRRMLVTLDEFASALHQINANDEWKRIRGGCERDTERRWDDAVKYFSANRPKWNALRDSIGGHLKEKAVPYAVDHLGADSTGTVEIVVHREEQSAGIRLLYAEEIVATAMIQALGTGEHTEEDIRLYLNDLFTVMMTATNEAVKAVYVIAIVYNQCAYTRSVIDGSRCPRLNEFGGPASRRASRLAASALGQPHASRRNDVDGRGLAARNMVRCWHLRRAAGGLDGCHSPRD